MDTHWLGDLGFLANDLDGLKLNQHENAADDSDSSFDLSVTSVTVGPSTAKLPAVVFKRVLDVGAIAPPTPKETSFSVEPAATSTPAPQGSMGSKAVLPGEIGGIESVSQLGKHRPAFCVFVASLAASLDDDALHEHVVNHFGEYGHILSVKVLRDPQNRPYAFVQYGTQEEFDNALEKAHRSTLDEREIRCEPARVNRTVLICSDFVEHPVTFSGTTLMCAPYGQVEKLTPFDGTIGNGMFVRFAHRDDAARAYVGLQSESWMRIYWVQNVADGGSGKYDPKQAFVGQLQPDVTEEELRAKFEAYGEITQVEITARSTFATAFVCYKSAMSTAQAIERLNHTMWKGRLIHVQNRQDKAKVRPQLAPPPSHIHGMGDWSERDVVRARSWDWQRKKGPQKRHGWQVRPRVQLGESERNGERSGERNGKGLYKGQGQGNQGNGYRKGYQQGYKQANGERNGRDYQKRGSRQKVETQFVPIYYPVGYYGYNNNNS